MEENKISDAVLQDPRPLGEVVVDYTHEQLYGGLPVVWAEKPQDKWFKVSSRNQDGSFSCVKQSSATAVEAMLGSVISAGTYKLRADKTSGGMYLQNCGDIDYNQGITYENDTPSQKMNDSQMDAITLPTLVLKTTGYRTFSNMDIEKVAEAIQAYGNCILSFGANGAEWQRTPVYNGKEVTFNHAICAIDFTLINGVKTLICMDSAGQWSSPDGIRLITKDYFNKRCHGGMYYLGYKIKGEVEVPLKFIPWLIDLFRKLGIYTGKVLSAIKDL